MMTCPACGKPIDCPEIEGCEVYCDDCPLPEEPEQEPQDPTAGLELAT